MGGRKQRDNVGVDAIPFQDLVYEFHGSLIGEIGIRTSFQYTGVATLEAERENIERYIRASLVNHADDTEGYTDTMQAQTVGQGFLLRDKT